MLIIGEPKVLFLKAHIRIAEPHMMHSGACTPFTPDFQPARSRSPVRHVSLIVRN